jgi:hypothetical protein
MKYLAYLNIVWRFHYKQCWTTSNITKNSIRDRYKPISKNTKTLDPLLYYDELKNNKKEGVHKSGTYGLHP